MNVTERTPKPKQPKQAGRNYVSWIIFLLILARPLWGILRSVISPGISSQQILMIVAGVIGLGVVAVIAMRARDSRPSASRLPTTYGPPQSTLPTLPSYKPSRSTFPTTLPASSSTLPRPPTFEPVITGTVVLVGIVVAAIIGSVIGFILLVSA